MQQHPDLCIAGAGIIGLTLALEMHRRGFRVAVLDQGAPLAESSTAAAGMLAAEDPKNPAALRELATLSLALYPAFLDRLYTSSSHRVAFQTEATLQSLPPGSLNSADALSPVELARRLPALHPGDSRFTLLNERSLDPRQLAAALLAAVRATTIDLRPYEQLLEVRHTGNAVELRTSRALLPAAKFVDCTGAWAGATSRDHILIAPKKGQMLSIVLPESLPLNLVVRTPEVYIVPRTAGPNAGCAIIGATVEDAGFDKTVHAADIVNLRALATALLPPLANAPQLAAWSGLRPATPDGLPLLGSLRPHQPNRFLAAGHFRNGILLAPGTARVMAQLLSGEPAAIDLTPFSPQRFTPQTS